MINAPLGKGMYTFSDVDQILKLKRGQSYRMLRGKYLSEEIGVYGNRGYTHVDFLTMIELMVVSELRAMGVKPREIRNARAMLIKQGYAHPFADKRLRTDGGRIIWDNAEGMLEVTSNQTMLKRVMKSLLKKISFSDHDNMASRLYLLKKTVVVDPMFAFGSPSVAGTRVKTRLIHGYHQSGWSNSRIASEFGIKSAAVADAVAYEDSLLKTAKS
jgi:uncharacterized protein (DUF433 family)